MSTCRTHLTLIQEAAARYADAPAFMVPRLAADNVAVERWLPISFRQFLSDVEDSACFWSDKLARLAVRPSSTVGVWLGGLTYLDAVTIYGVARAGFVPQLVSLKMPNPDVVLELLERTGARALIHDVSFEHVLAECPVPRVVAPTTLPTDVDRGMLPPLRTPTSGDEIVMIYHTSGSTSGSPKLVPCTSKWVNAAVEKTYHFTRPQSPDKQDVTVWMGSMCHIGQTYQLIGYLQHGVCIIQPTRINFSSEELLDMVERCGLNRLNQFATFLASHIRAARKSPSVLRALRTLDELLYAGLPLPAEEEEWARSQGLSVRNLFGSTECGAMLISVGGTGPDAGLLQPIPGTSYGFLPLPDSSEHNTASTSTSPDAALYNTNNVLTELVILSSSPDCPHPSLLTAPDGHYHTGDLFAEVQPGKYAFRGRDDDWIKSETSLRCDTRAIEENVRATCADLVSECVVVGNGRPSPALFVEPRAADADAERLKRDILRRTRHFHARRYVHERIVLPDCVVVVPAGSLPRTATKGNIRRRAVEERYKSVLDRIYGVS